MKIRNDFVSNSSSSSFIVISNKGKYSNILKCDDSLVLPTDYAGGCCQFGWQTEKYYDVYSKLNWCALVILAKREIEDEQTANDVLKEHIAKPWFRSNDMEKMLKKVCSEKLGINISIISKSDGYYDGYIDHQSNINESPENGRMFMSYDILYDFIANENSYIDNSNDNDGICSLFSTQPQDYTI